MDSGVFFEGVKMPQNCLECPMVHKEGQNPIFARYYCRAKVMVSIYHTEAAAGRREGCPAREMKMCSYVSLLYGPGYVPEEGGRV